MKNLKDRTEFFWKCSMFAVITLLGVFAAFYMFNIDGDGAGAGISADLKKSGGDSGLDSIIRPRFATGSNDVADRLTQAPTQSHGGGSNTGSGSGFQSARVPMQHPGGHTPLMPSFNARGGMFGSIREQFEQMRRAMHEMMGADAFSPGLSSGGSGFGGDAADSIRSNTMSETKDGYTLRMKIPGLDKSSLDVRLRNNTLIVSGSRNQQVEQSAGGSRFLSSSFSSFSYSFHVPGQVGSDKLEVSYDDDILDVLIRK